MILVHLSRCRKEIALLLANVFLAGGYASLKAQSHFAPTHTTNGNMPIAAYFVDNLPSHSLAYLPDEKPNQFTSQSKVISSVKKTPPIADHEEVDGPGQPEMQSFQSVNANNLVDLFSGDFSYNIPLLDVGGYPLNLHYSSGISMDQEASWVGLGWNVNPGTITRNMRGVPDDFNGRDSIKKTFSVKDNITAGVSADFKPEIFGIGLNVGTLHTGVNYNNYTGPSLEVGINPTILSSKSALGDKNFGVDEMNLGVGLNFSTAGGFSANANFMTGIKNKQTTGIEGAGNIGLNYSSRKGLENLTVSFKGYRKEFLDKANQAKNPMPFVSSISFARSASVPQVTNAFTSFQFSFKAKAGGEIFGFHPLGAVGGYYSQQYIKDEDKTIELPAYGYLHYQAGNSDQKALLDFNRENDHPYSPRLPHIGIPVYTYDTYSITGEGTGGMFRPYRGDVGFVRDHYLKSKNYTGNLGLDLGGGNIYHFGADLAFNYTYTANKQWETENTLKNLIPFKESDGTYEAVYFRNPSEKASVNTSFYNSLGGRDLLRIGISNDAHLPQATGTLFRYNDEKRFAGTQSVSTQTSKVSRDKRQQVISYLTAKEASIIGLDTAIQSFPYNKFLLCRYCDTLRGMDTTVCFNCRFAGPSGCDTVVKESRINQYRKPHHLSQITVLNPDGRTYVYGIPAYNFVQKETTFSVDKTQASNSTGLVRYNAGSDNTTSNDKGKDHFFSSEETPAYAHSFLLSGVLSPDYVDVKGDGITPDDLGDAVKFNYTRIYSKQSPFRWRTPYAADSASYNEGFKSDKSDDKGNYVYGEKEIWYLHSIESKTMVAAFTLEDREDSKGTFNENGGRDNTQKLKRLKEINLYAKNDLTRYGMAAKPIKTVHFGYSYRLCKGTENTAQDSGKLTLESIWFTYNKNNKGKQNPYQFKYKENPAYQKKAYDRWGNYKQAADNPNNLSNDEFPYTVQDSAVAARRIAAWMLDTIYLPAGGRMVVDYESDDYAFVQNRRAMQMFTLAGFSHLPNDTTSISSNLYNGQGDMPYVYFDLPESVTSKEFFQKYLQGNTKLFFRLNVEMPTDTYGGGFENIPLYAEIDGYGVQGTASKKPWVKLKYVKGQSPLTMAAMQYLRLNLPSKAYPGSDVQGSNAAAAMVRILFSVASNLMNMVTSFDNVCRTYGWVKKAAVSKSIVRLNSPNYKKLGGGLRVKRIRLYDSWTKMGGGKEAEYGQEYSYTTTHEINGKPTQISSGVATYEPQIGGEENPFHQPMEYSESSSIVGPTFGYYIDNPVAETFFPSPSVGYSKVRVTSINRKKTRSANGFSETEFYTAYDFPVKSDFTPFDRESKRNFNSPLKYFLPDSRHYLTLTQGFKIELNDMNGKMKSQSVYAETDSVHPISYTRNFYLVQNGNAQHQQLSNDVTMVKADGRPVQGSVGVDIELMVDLREQFSETVGANVQFNQDGFILPFFIPIFLNIPSFIPVPNHSINLYRSAAVMKVVQNYGILDSVVHFEKGSKVSVKNVLYDEETGEPVLTRTQNSFDDAVYNFTYLAHWTYSGAGSAYRNIGYTQKNMTFFEGQTSLPLNHPFVGGDEILATGKEGSKVCGGSYNYNTYVTTKKLWVVDGNKMGQSGLYFIDRNGKTYTANNVEVKVVRSGRRNMASTPIGSVTSLRHPIQPPYIPGIGTQVRYTDASKVLAASAVQMKEDWKGDPIRTICDDTALGYAVNPYIQGMLGAWRPFRSMTYYGKRAEGNPAAQTDIRKNGTFADFTPFWNFPSNSIVIALNSPTPVYGTTDTSRWVWNSETTLFNRKGYELENRDPLGRYNSGLYGYNSTLPVAVVQNAKYREALYEGFEDFINDTISCFNICSQILHSGFRNPLPLGPVGKLDSSQSHTGRYSLQLKVEDHYRIKTPISSDSGIAVIPFSILTSDGTSYSCQPKVGLTSDNHIQRFSPIQGSKILVSAWAKLSQNCGVVPETNGGRIDVIFYDNANNYISGSAATIRRSPTLIEGWQRMEKVVNVPLNAAYFEITFWADFTGGETVNFDDLRIHPFNANMKSFVYHPTNLRLMAELDENNYATFYEYDDDGTLVRVKKETEKGIKTIKETRSSLVKN